MSVLSQIFLELNSALQRWNDFLCNNIPIDIWVKIFCNCLDSSEIDNLARVCRRWNYIVRIHAKTMIYVYLHNKISSAAGTSLTWFDKTLRSLINLNGENLVEFKKLWDFRFEHKSKKAIWVDPISDNGIFIYESGRIDFGEVGRRRNDTLIMCTTSVMFATLYNKQSYSGKIKTIQIPAVGYEIETTADDSIIIKKKIKI